MTELAMNTASADRRIGSHRETRWIMMLCQQSEALTRRPCRWNAARFPPGGGPAGGAQAVTHDSVRQHNSSLDMNAAPGASDGSIRDPRIRDEWSAYLARIAGAMTDPIPHVSSDIDSALGTGPGLLSTSLKIRDISSGYAASRSSCRCRLCIAPSEFVDGKKIYHIPYPTRLPSPPPLSRLRGRGAIQRARASVCALVAPGHPSPAQRERGRG